MHLRALLIPFAVVLAACAGVGEETTDAIADAPLAPPPAVTDEPPVGSPIVETRPHWKGFAETMTGEPTLAAYALGPVDVFESPDAPDPLLTLDHTTILGTVTVLGVVTEPRDGWVEVMLPVRPNGSTGWVREDGVSLYVVDGEIVIDLSDRKLSYRVDGVEMLETEVGIGSKHNQTPVGHYFVTDNVTLANPNSPWGPHALGISARSDTITAYNGGDGIIGIHGTNNPGSIGGNISLGCVRLPNDMITTLHELVPLGTRVIVNA